jgi:hypothetical protein
MAEPKPLGHCRHSIAPTPGAYFPPGQSVHIIEPGMENLPAGHIVQSLGESAPAVG